MALSSLGPKPDKLSDTVYDAIRDAIVNRELLPGESVTEAKLAMQLAVSKTPVREALLKLEYIGLIEADGNRGGRVAVPSVQSLRSAYEVREGLEVQAAQLAAQRRTDAVASSLLEVADGSVAASEAFDVEGFRALDRNFHLSVADASANEPLSKMVRDAFDLSWTLRLRDAPLAEASLGCARQHTAIADAVLHREPERAMQEMREHIRKVGAIVIAEVGGSSDLSGVMA